MRELPSGDRRARYGRAGEGGAPHRDRDIRVVVRTVLFPGCTHRDDDGQRRRREEMREEGEEARSRIDYRRDADRGGRRRRRIDQLVGTRADTGLGARSAFARFDRADETVPPPDIDVPVVRQHRRFGGGDRIGIAHTRFDREERRGVELVPRGGGRGGESSGRRRRRRR